MISLYIYFSFTMMITLILLMIINLISFKSSLKFDTLSPFECGFEPEMHYRLNFSLHFFLIALLFLIFDIELIILFPFIKLTPNLPMLKSGIVCLLFLLILLLGIVYEWNMKSLNWIF